MKNVLYIGNNLKQQRANVSAIGRLGPKLTEEGFRVRYASSKSHKTQRLLDMLWACVRYGKASQWVLVDTYSTQNFYYALLVSQLCRIMGVPYIPILHGGNLPSRLKTNPLWSQMLFKPAYALVSPSVYLKEAFEASGYKKLQYIPNSLELEQYEFQEKEYSEVKLLWVRAFASIYNPELAVHVLKALQVQGINASLCMVGPDTDGSMERVKSLATNLGVSVTITGKLPKKDWIALAKDYNIFINTTNYDNMPVSVIEAMALGLPVVSTNVGGLPYLLQHEKEALLVPPKDVEAFVTAIKQLIHNPEATRTMAFHARKKVEQFDWNLVKHQWFELLS